MRTIFLPALLLLSLASPALALEAEKQNDANAPAANEAAPSTASPASSIPAAVSPWLPGSYAAGATHYLGFKDDIDPLTVIDLSANWKTDSYSFVISQRFNKLYSVAKGDSEVQAADTAMGVSRALKNKPYDFDLKVGFSLTLPVSEFSQRQDIYTKPRLSLSARRAFLEKKLNYQGTLAFQYNFSEFKTTKTGRGTGGGNPLRESIFTFDNSLAYELVEKLTASASVTYVKVRYFDIGYKNRVSTADSSALFGTDYSLGLNLAYAFSETWTGNIGYSQSDAVEKTGGIQEAYLFDLYASQWYLGVSAAF